MLLSVDIAYNISWEEAREGRGVFAVGDRWDVESLPYLLQLSVVSASFEGDVFSVRLGVVVECIVAWEPQLAAVVEIVSRTSDERISAWTQAERRGDVGLVEVVEF